MMASTLSWRWTSLFGLVLCLAALIQADNAQPLLTTLTVTSSSVSIITASYSLSTSVDPNCNRYRQNCDSTVVSVAVLSTVTEYLPATVVSTIGETTVVNVATQTTLSGPTDGATATSAVAITSLPETTAPLTTSASSAVVTMLSVSTMTMATTVSMAESASKTAASTPQSSTSAPAQRKGLSAGANVGLAAGGLCGVAIISALAFVFGRGSRDRKGFHRLGKLFPFPFLLAGGKNGSDRDDDSTTQVDSSSPVPPEKMAEDETEASNRPRNDMEDPEFARAFFSRSQKA